MKDWNAEDWAVVVSVVGFWVAFILAILFA